MFEIRLDCSPWAAPPPHSDLGDRSNIIHYIPQPLGHPLKVQCYSQNCAFSISLVQPCRIRERGWSVGSDIKNSVSFNCTQSMLGARHTFAEGGCFVRVCVGWVSRWSASPQSVPPSNPAKPKYSSPYLVDFVVELWWKCLLLIRCLRATRFATDNNNRVWVWAPPQCYHRPFCIVEGTSPLTQTYRCIW